MKYFAPVAAAVLIVAATPAHAQTIKACVNSSSGEIKIRETCQPGWTALSLSAGASAGGKLVGEKSWTGNTFIVSNDPKTLPDSTFTARTAGGPLLITTVISLRHGSAEESGFAKCYPEIDGQWAGVYGNLPAGDPPLDKEPALFMDRFTENIVPWTPSRVYPGVAAGVHTFGLRCEAAIFNVFGPGGFSAGVNMPASLAIIELQQ